MYVSTIFPLNWADFLQFACILDVLQSDVCQSILIARLQIKDMSEYLRIWEGFRTGYNHMGEGFQISLLNVSLVTPKESLTGSKDQLFLSLLKVSLNSNLVISDLCLPHFWEIIPDSSSLDFLLLSEVPQKILETFKGSGWYAWTGQKFCHLISISVNKYWLLNFVIVWVC